MTDEDLEKLLGDPSFLRQLPRAARLKPRTKPQAAPVAPPPPEAPQRRSLKALGLSPYTGKPIQKKHGAHPNVIKASLTPEVLEKRRLGGLKGSMLAKMKGGRVGVPNGCTLEQAQEAWEKANKEADIIMENMKKEGLVTDEDLGNEALHFAVSVVRNEKLPLREKLGAAKLVLEFCKSKPVAKQEVSVTKAEDFLAALVSKKD